MDKRFRIKLTKLEINNCLNVAIKYLDNAETKALIVQLNGIQWSKTNDTYFLPYTYKTINFLFKYFRSHRYYVDYSEFKKTITLAETSVTKKKPDLSMAQMYKKLPTDYKKLLTSYTGFLKGKRLSKSTIKSYGYFVLRFFHYYKAHTLEHVTKKDIAHFFEVVLYKENFSISSHRQCVSALKYLITYCELPQIDTEDLQRPKKSRKLPVVLSKEEIIDLMQVTRNLKHRTIIGLMYSCGLRIGELLNLKLSALDFDRNQLRVTQAKGRKDRSVLMSLVLRPMLLNYINTYQPKHFLFEGRNGKPYAAVSVRQFLKNSCYRAQITKKVTPHVLRHSYATHLMENGVDIRHIQTLLGHAKPETTMIYTHVAHRDLMQIENPLDTVVSTLKTTQKESQKVLLSQNFMG